MELRWNPIGVVVGWGENLVSRASKKAAQERVKLRKMIETKIAWRSKNHVLTNRLWPNVKLAEPVQMGSKGVRVDMNEFGLGGGREQSARCWRCWPGPSS